MIYYVLSVIQNPGGPEGDGSGGSGEFYYYDIATGHVVFVQQLPIGIYTSADLRDNEEEHTFLISGNDSNIWSGNPASSSSMCTPVLKNKLNAMTPKQN